jgi:hypothetical protein
MKLKKDTSIWQLLVIICICFGALASKDDDTMPVFCFMHTIKPTFIWLNADCQW